MSSARNKYVAVVDDESSLCAAWSRLLRLEGFQPITYPSAEAYLDDEKHPTFDCLMVDIRLGGMSGLDLLRRLSAEGPHPPVIFITALDDRDIQAEAEALGCAGYFRKSTAGVDIIEAIRRVT